MILTHRNPDLDAITGVWLLKRFNGLEREEVEFVDAGVEAARFPQARAIVDTGKEFDAARLRFDHHQLTGQEANTCAALQIYTHLNTAGTLDHLAALIDLVCAFDLGRDAAGACYDFGVHALLSGYKSQAQSPSSADVLAYGCGLLDTLERYLANQAEAQRQYREKVVYRSDDERLVALKQGTRRLTDAALRDGAQIVVFEGRPEEAQGTLSYSIGIVRARGYQGPHAGALAERAARRRPELGEEIERWYKHPAGFFAGRGTAKKPDLRPVTIDVVALAREIDAAWDRAPDDLA